MSNLIIIAGCNGAGKSVFAPSFLPIGLSSFDYDKLFLQNYKSLPDSELREEIAKNKIKLNDRFLESVGEAVFQRFFERR